MANPKRPNRYPALVQVRLTAEMDAALTALVEKTGASASDIIREGVRRELARRDRLVRRHGAVLPAAPSRLPPAVPVVARFRGAKDF